MYRERFEEGGIHFDGAHFRRDIAAKAVFKRRLLRAHGL